MVLVGVLTGLAFETSRWNFGNSKTTKGRYKSDLSKYGTGGRT